MININNFSIKNINIFNKIVLIRSDFNVPIKNGKILSDLKIKHSLETIIHSINSGSYVIICSHLGNPNGIEIEELSLYPISKYLENKLNMKVNISKNYLDYGINFKNKNEIILLENVRFNKGETENDLNLSKKYSKLCDVYVMDAFASSHRINSSTYGIIKYSKKSCLGFLFIKEYNNLSIIFNKPRKPIISIVGGSKVSNKINFIKKLLEISDKVFVFGGISNNLLLYKNYNVGKSILENNLNEKIKEIIHNKNLILPIDVRVSKNLSKNSEYKNKFIKDINDDDIILDIGENTVNYISDFIKKANTLIWSGPVGVFEFKNFSYGTLSILKSIDNNKNLFSIIGGGDTLFALKKFKYLNKVSYFSTGGGAFLSFISKNKIPLLNLILKKEINK